MIINTKLKERYGFAERFISPLPMSNLWGWWSADRAFTDAGKTTLCSSSGSDTCYTLEDQSGNSRDLVQATAGSRPTWYSSQLNGYPSLRFDGANDSMSKTVSSAFTAATIYIITKQTSWENNGQFIGLQNLGYINQKVSSPDFAVVNGVTGGTGSGLSLGVYGLIGAKITATNSSQCFFGAGDFGSAGNQSGSSMTSASVDIGGDAFLNGDIVEALIYDASHTYNSGDGLSVRKYLNQKYNLGLTL